MANKKTSQLTEVTTLPDNAKIYAVDESRAVGDRSVQINKSNLIPADVPQPITTASTNYTLLEADIKAWTPYRFTSNNIVITIPSITFEEFIVLNMQHTGTGTVTIQSGSGVTFPDQTFTTDKAFSIASYADDVWDIYSLEVGQGTALTGQTFTGAIALDNTLSTYYNTYDLSVSGTPTYSVLGGAVTSGQAYIPILSDGVTPFATESNFNPPTGIFDEQYNVPSDFILVSGLHRLYVLKTADGVAISAPTNLFIPDVIAPTVISATIDIADQLSVLFSEDVNVTNTTGLSLDAGLSAFTIDSILSGNGTSSVVFQLSASVSGGEAGDFVYGGTNTIEDISGNALVAGSTAVTNNISGLVFTTVGFAEASNVFTKNSGTTYLTGYAVSTTSFAGEFTYEVEVESALNDGIMIGVSTDGTNRAYNTAPKWEFGIYNVSTDLRTIINGNVGGVATGGAGIWSPTLGDKLKITRDASNNILIYYNATLVQNYGVLAGSLFVHFSMNALNQTVNNPTVTE